MSIDVTFNDGTGTELFKKRVNDCSFPLTWQYNFPCLIKDDCSIVNPTILIDRVAFDTFLADNPARKRPIYCKIPDFERYYFVTDFRYKKSVIEIDLECDVLATYRTEITSETHYVLRSSSQYNQYIPDTMYPAQQNVDLLATPFAYAWKQSFNQGCFAFSIVGSGASSYYLMSYADFNSFVRYLLSDDYASRVIGAMALSAYPQYKMVVDPLQYLSSVMWLPLDLATIAADNTNPVVQIYLIGVGYVSVDLTNDFPSPGISGYRVNNAVFRHVVSFGTNAGAGAYTLYTHPSAATRGQYMNLSPWTSIQVYYPPFGLIDLDTVQLALYEAVDGKGVWLQLTTDVDLRTGSATLTIYRFRTRPNETPDHGQFMTTINSQLGVPFEIGQVINPGTGLSTYLTFGAQLVADAAAIGASVSNENYAGAAQAIGNGVGNVVTGVGNMIKSKIPMVKCIGGTGGVDAIAEAPEMIYQFIYPSPEARGELGRVLCDYVQLGNLTGYILCRDANTMAGKTQGEKDKINYFLNTGFFNGDWSPSP